MKAMSMIPTVRLVNTLSKVEKRQFKLLTKKQTGNKDYLDLFNIIDQSQTIDLSHIKEKFKKKHPHVSPGNAARYLLHLLTDNLVSAKIKNDTSFQLLHGIMRIRLLEERSIYEEAGKELRKLGQISVSSKDHLIRYFIYRKEMEYLSEKKFRKTKEKQLINMQMEGRQLLKNLTNIHEHQSLYNILTHRLIRSGKTLSERDREKLNDLVLHEIGLVTRRIKQHFESKKLHLLFQSFFFSNTGDYKSALKSYSSLNLLFEKNPSLWDNPPMGYFSALDGILDSMRANEDYEDMEFYIQKLQQLQSRSYPEYFLFLVKKTHLIYQIIQLTGTNSLKRAVQLLNDTEVRLLKAYKMVDDEKQNELCFHVALTYFLADHFKKAYQYINEVILIGSSNYQSMIYRACRLLNMVMLYEEKEDLDYLDYEIRSYKRALKGKGKLLKTERLLFKTIQINPDLNGKRKNEILWTKKIAPTVKAIKGNKYEGQILKYFDFVGWAKKKFGV